MDLVKKDAEYYGKMAGWEDYVAPLINFFKKIHWERIEALVTSESMQSIAFWRSRSFDNYEKTEALAKEDFFNLNKYDSNRSRMYVAERLKRICCVLGTYENQLYPGPEGYFEVKTWRPADTFRLVVDGNRDPDTVGKALALVDWFRHCLQEFEQCEQTAPAPPVLPAAGAENLKTMRQVVLLHIYQNAPISHAQASAIAEKYGFSSPTSGQKLYGTYNKLAHQTNARTGVAARGLRSMITDIQAVIPHLTESDRQQANTDLQKLKMQK